MLNLHNFLALCFLCIGLPALADVYKYVDENGNVTFTNTPVKGAKRIFIEPAPNQPSKSANTPKSSVSNSTPKSFPRVSAGTQKTRDVNRKRILQDELATEERLLSKSQQALAEAESKSRTDSTAITPAKLTLLRDNVTLHQKNISALQDEIGKIH